MQCSVVVTVLSHLSYIEMQSYAACCNVCEVYMLCVCAGCVCTCRLMSMATGELVLCNVSSLAQCPQSDLGSKLILTLFCEIANPDAQCCTY